MYAVQIHCKLLTVLNFTAIMHYYYTLNSFLIGREHTVNF